MTVNPGVCRSSLEVAANVRRVRKNLGWSQPRLARESGLSNCMISFLEGGHRNFTLPAMEMIAEALGVSVRDLLMPVRAAAGDMRAGSTRERAS